MAVQDDVADGMPTAEELPEREELHVAETTQGSGGAIIVNERFVISTDSPLPELNSPSASAFACRDMADTNHSLMALVCDQNLPPRAEDLHAFRRIERDVMLRPVEWAVTEWPGTDYKRFVLVVDRPAGRRLAHAEDEMWKAMPEERVMRGVIQPLLPVLKDLSDSVLAHRSFRVDNIFYKDAVTGEIVLGEGFSAPPAFHQPAIYEPIDSAMCEPGGRGSGSIADDLYSFGVVMALLLTGRNPMHGKTAEQVVEAKLRDGSYASVVGDSRITLTMMEPLRGLLTDDRNERWTVAELELWLNGRRLTPKPAKLPARAQRAFKFEADEYLTAQELSNGLAHSWTAATRVVANDPVDVWLRRGLEDDTRADAYLSAIRTAAAFGGRQGIEDRMVSRALMVLDPDSPVRYRAMAARIDAFPWLLMTRMMQGQDTKDINEAVQAKLPTFWIDNQANQRPEYGVLKRNFETMSFMLGRLTAGYGIERCLYDNCPTVPCLSPMIDKQYVLSVNHLLKALDGCAVERGGKGEPMDRHIAAFIASRLKHPTDTLLQGLANDRDQGARRMATIRLLAEVQQYTNEETPPALAQWVVRLVGPIIDSYQNRPFRDRLAREVKKLSEKGSLMDLAFALENTTRREKDNEGFRAAVNEYSEAEYEIQRIEAGEMTKPEVIERKGQEVASMASGVLAVFALMFILLVRIVMAGVGS
ncbi:MAG: hypothetical protein JNK11_15095 [Alphaproteobacteria bacterium]|nr:hypothetical protein [Alphaproteobacteria bacterium]